MPTWLFMDKLHGSNEYRKTTILSFVRLNRISGTSFSTLGKSPPRSCLLKILPGGKENTNLLQGYHVEIPGGMEAG